MAQNTVYSINGPVVKVREAGALQMQEKVFVGHKRLIGEVISVGSGETTIQVYEGTTGMRPRRTGRGNRRADVRGARAGYPFKHL